MLKPTPRRIHVVRLPASPMLEYDSPTDAYRHLLPSGHWLIIPGKLFLRACERYAEQRDASWDEAVAAMLRVSQWNILEGHPVYRIGERAQDALIFAQDGYACKAFSVPTWLFENAVSYYMTHYRLSANAATWHAREISQWGMSPDGPYFYI